MENEQKRFTLPMWNRTFPRNKKKSAVLKWFPTYSWTKIPTNVNATQTIYYFLFLSLLLFIHSHVWNVFFCLAFASPIAWFTPRECPRMASYICILPLPNIEKTIQSSIHHLLRGFYLMLFIYFNLFYLLVFFIYLFILAFHLLFSLSLSGLF